MKTEERLGLTGSILFLACMIGLAVVRPLVVGYYASGPTAGKAPAGLMAAMTGLTLTQAMITLLLHIAIAAWLHRMALRASARPALWAVFGFLFGITAAALFCFARTVEERRPA